MSVLLCTELKEGGWSDSEQLLGQVASLVDASVHGDEAVNSGFVSHVGIMETGVQHNDGKGQHITRVWGQKRRTESWETNLE